MSILFTPIKIGPLEIPNRFVRSATCECMALKSGEMTPKTIELYRELAKGDIGLIISGHCYVHPTGKAMEYQNGLHSDEMIPSMKRVVETVHRERGKIAIQLTHGGLQCGKGIPKKLIAPSKVRSAVTFMKPKQMNETLIHEIIQAFVDAARRAGEAGADAVQIHAAHGYLVNEFISPFFNRRNDDWGGSDEKRFRFLKDIVTGIKEILPHEKALLVKLNTNDYVRDQGITPPLAIKYAKWLEDLKIDAIELSCGTTHFSNMNIWRGKLPLDEILLSFPHWQRPLVKRVLKKMIGKYDLEREYNLEAAKMIKPEIGNIPLILVGGIRKLSNMEQIVDSGHADCISMSRPFIREPDLVKKFQQGNSDQAVCDSCNKCLGGSVNYLPLACYVDGMPRRR